MVVEMAQLLPRRLLLLHQMIVRVFWAVKFWCHRPAKGPRSRRVPYAECATQSQVGKVAVQGV